MAGLTSAGRRAGAGVCEMARGRIARKIGSRSLDKLMEQASLLRRQVWENLGTNFADARKRELRKVEDRISSIMRRM